MSRSGSSLVLESIWYHFFRPCPNFSEAGIVQILSAAGIRAHIRRTEEILGSGIIILTDITKEVCNFLSESSNHGHRRVLAVVTSSSLLRDGGAWKLLHSGASDVLAWDKLAIQCGERIAARLERWDAVEKIMTSTLVQENVVESDSVAWSRALRQCVEVAQFTGRNSPDYRRERNG